MNKLRHNLLSSDRDTEKDQSKEPSTNSLRLWCAGLLIASVGLWLTGCATVCCENRKAGLATITCQPMDVETTIGGETEFEVKARGLELRYQWYFQNEPLSVDGEKGRKYQGVQTNRLIVSHVKVSDVGPYHCEIISKDCDGVHVRTSTRWASLGIGFTPYLLEVSPPTQSLPPPVPVTVQGTQYCSSLFFCRNGDRPLSGTTRCVFTVLWNEGSPTQPPSTDPGRDNYDILVYDSHGHQFWATKSPGVGATTKEFSLSQSSPPYLFRYAVYFKCTTSPTNWPQVSLTPKWLP